MHVLAPSRRDCQQLKVPGASLTSAQAGVYHPLDPLASDISTSTPPSASLVASNVCPSHGSSPIPCGMIPTFVLGRPGSKPNITPATTPFLALRLEPGLGSARSSHILIPISPAYQSVPRCILGSSSSSCQLWAHLSLSVPTSQPHSQAQPKRLPSTVFDVCIFHLGWQWRSIGHVFRPRSTMD